MRQLFALSLILSTGCGPESGSKLLRQASASAILPEALTVADTLIMRHTADALGRATQLTLDATPLVTITSGGDTTFALNFALPPLMLADGRFVIPTMAASPMLLFDRNGAPVRKLGAFGFAADQFSLIGMPLLLEDDTLMILEGSWSRLTRFTADSGIIRRDTLSEFPNGCFSPIGFARDGRLLSFSHCIQQRAPRQARMPSTIVATAADFSRHDTIATPAGYEYQFTADSTNPAPRWRYVPDGRRPHAVVWNGSLWTADGTNGYQLERRDTNGRITGLLRLEPADTTRSFYNVQVDRSGYLWVWDPATLQDTVYRATAFRTDGAIIARLIVALKGRPVTVAGGRVILREESATGEVTFAVYQIVSGGEH
jgi:hypothetical protein